MSSGPSAGSGKVWATRPAHAAAGTTPTALPLALLALTPRGRLNRLAGALLTIGYLAFAITELSR